MSKTLFSVFLKKPKGPKGPVVAVKKTTIAKNAFLNKEVYHRVTSMLLRRQQEGRLGSNFANGSTVSTENIQLRSLLYQFRYERKYVHQPKSKETSVLFVVHWLERITTKLKADLLYGPDVAAAMRKQRSNNAHARSKNYFNYMPQQHFLHLQAEKFKKMVPSLAAMLRISEDQGVLPVSLLELCMIHMTTGKNFHLMQLNGKGEVRLGFKKKRPGFYCGVSGKVVQSHGTWDGTKTVNANCTFNELLRKVVFVLKHLYEQI